MPATTSSLSLTPAGALRRPGSGPRLNRITVYGLFVVPGLLLLVLGFILPVGQVLVASFQAPDFSLKNYIDMVTNPHVQRVSLTTLRVCVETTILTVVAGYILAYVIAHVRTGLGRLFLFCVLVPFWLSVLTRAFAWVTLLRSNGVINSALLDWGLLAEPLPMMRNEIGTVIGMVHYMLPYAVLPLLAGFRDFDTRLISAARGMGASPAYAFFKIFLPLSIPAVAGATTLVFVFSLGFYVTPAILGGGKSLMVAEMIAVSITTTMRWELAAAMATTLLCVVFLALGIMARLLGFRRLFGLPS